MGKSDLSVIIVNFNTLDLVMGCVRSIYESKPQISFNLWVVDNGSTNGSVESILKKFPEIHLIKNKKNLGFSAGNNAALKQAKSRFYLLLNSDAKVFKDSLDNLVSFMDGSDFGIASCLLINSNGSFQPNAGELPFGLSLFFWISGLDDILVPLRERLPSFHRHFRSFYKNGREVGWVSGSVMIIRDEVLKKVGLLDEKIFMYGEDVEYCLRAKKAGFRTGWTDRAKIWHLGGGSSKNPSYKQWIGEFRGLLYLYKRHGNYFGETLFKMLAYLFLSLRSLAFLLAGKPETAKIYVSIIKNI